MVRPSSRVALHSDDDEKCSSCDTARRISPNNRCDPYRSRLVISAGPFPLMAVLALAALALAWGFARGLTPAAEGMRSRAGAVVLDSFLWGLLAARLGHVLVHAPDYLSSPVSIIRLGDGGYSISAGVVVAALYAFWKTRGQVPRKPVLLGLAAGIAFWGIGAMALFAVQRSTIPLPVVELADVQGNAVPLQSYAGKPLVLNLWATWCGPCRREMPVLVQAQQAHPAVNFVFANQGEEAGEIVAYLTAEKMAPAHVLVDIESEVMRQTGARALPTTLFFDAEGRLQRVHMGELSRATLETRLREIQ
jgi:thiol-disulfide isomerase/thioredoxin